MKTLLALLTTYPLAFGAILGSAIAFLQCRRLARRLERGEIPLPDANRTTGSVKELLWFFRALFT